MLESAATPKSEKKVVFRGFVSHVLGYKCAGCGGAQHTPLHESLDLRPFRGCDAEPLPGPVRASEKGVLSARLRTRIEDST